MEQAQCGQFWGSDSGGHVKVFFNVQFSLHDISVSRRTTVETLSIALNCIRTSNAHSHSHAPSLGSVPPSPPSPPPPPPCHHRRHFSVRNSHQSHQPINHH